MDLFFQKEEK